MDFGLKDKTALVTGGSHGIGKSIAIGLAKEGCKVVICSRSNERLLEAKTELSKYSTEIKAINADVLRP